jgi:hypothetical protein
MTPPVAWLLSKTSGQCPLPQLDALEALGCDENQCGALSLKGAALTAIASNEVRGAGDRSVRRHAVGDLVVEDLEDVGASHVERGNWRSER